MTRPTTAESRALKSSFEAMGKLTQAYHSHKDAILADTRLRFEIKAKQQLKWLIEYAEITKDTGVQYAVGEARDVLRLMKGMVHELILKELENAKGKLTQAQLRDPAHVARIVGCSVDWANDYFEKKGRV